MPSVAMGRPVVIRKLSEYLFSTTAKVATLMSDVGQKAEAATAKGAVNVFVTDFGITLALTPNRLQGQRPRRHPRSSFSIPRSCSSR